MKRIRVLIVEDSPVVRALLVAIVESDPRFAVAGAFSTAEEALRCLAALAPDVISLDIRLPGMNGLEATRRIMAELPTPIVVVAASVDSDDLNIALNALRAGALAVLEKPSGGLGADFQPMADSILTQFFIMSQVKVVRQWGNAVRTARPISAATPARESDSKPFAPGALAIGCSTGGPGALSVLLRDLPADFPGPILLVQHIPPSFVPSFALWIASICSFPVNVVTEPQLLRPGHLYLAAAERHLGVRGGCAMSSEEVPVTGQRPSATYLFRLVTREFGSSAVGVLLSGMGEDGAEGLLDMRRAGAHTIVENETTAVVYGMPAAAVAIGAAAESLPLHQIAPRIAALFSRTPEKLEWLNKVTS